MTVTFKDSGLQTLCEDTKTAQKTLGPASAKKLRSRLADIQAAKNVRELIAGRPHPLKGGRAGQFAIDLAGGHRLVFEPANEPIPRTDDLAIDWANVTEVRIVFIGDYHD